MGKHKEKRKNEMLDISIKSVQSKTRICERSETTPYKSMYKAGYVTPANYIAELIVTKRNEFFNNGRTGESFWNQESKSIGYKRLQMQINRMLTLYHESSIIQAINASKCVPKIHYHHTWNDDTFKYKNLDFFNKIEAFDKHRVDLEVVQSDDVKVEISKKFGKSKNIFKDL